MKARNVCIVQDLLAAAFFIPWYLLYGRWQRKAKYRCKKAQNYKWTVMELKHKQLCSNKIMNCYTEETRGSVILQETCIIYTVSVLWDYSFFNITNYWQLILINWFLIQMAKCCKTNNMFNSSTFSSNKNSKNKQSTTKMGPAIPCIFLRDQIWWSKHKGQQKW